MENEGNEQCGSSANQVTESVLEAAAALEKTKELLITAKATIVESKELTEFLSQQNLDFVHDPFGYHVPYCSTRRPKRKLAKTGQPIPNFLPIFTKNDIVALLDEDRVVLGKISPLSHAHPAMRNNMGQDLVIGPQMNVYTMPDDDHDVFDFSKLVVIDRGFFPGDKVGWTCDSYMRQPRDRYFLWQQEHKGIHGIVFDYKVTGDVLILPQKQRVIRNVNLLDLEPLILAPCKAKEILDARPRHSLPRENIMVSHGGWVGELVDQINRITLEYEGQFKITFIDDEKTVKLNPADGSCRKKAWYPGQKVNVKVKELLDPASSWSPNEIPDHLYLQAKGIKGRKSILECTILSVEVEMMKVNWQHCFDADGVDNPPSLLKGQDCKNIKIVKRTQIICAGHRLTMPVKLLKDVETHTRKDFEDIMDNAFKDIIKKKEAAKLPDWYYPSGSTELEDYPRDLLSILRKPGKRLRQTNPQEPTQEPVFEPLEEYPSIEGSKNKVLIDSFEEDLLVEVLTTRSRVSVIWVDGTISEDIDGRLLSPIPERNFFHGASVTGIPALFPGNVVQRKNYPFKGPVTGNLAGPNTGIDLLKYQSLDNTVGVVLSVNDEERFAKIQWLEVQSGKAIEKKETEDCPLFELSPAMEQHKIAPGRLGLTTAAGQSPKVKRNSLLIAGHYTTDGRRMVHFIDGKTSFLWPIEMKPIFYLGSGMYPSAVGALKKNEVLHALSEEIKAEALEQFVSQNDPLPKYELNGQSSTMSDDWLAIGPATLTAAFVEKEIETPKVDITTALGASITFVQDHSQPDDSEFYSDPESLDESKFSAYEIYDPFVKKKFAVVLATMSAAAQIMHPESSLTKELRKQSEIWKNKSESNVDEVMNELVKCIQKGQLQMNDIDHAQFVARTSCDSSEKSKIPEVLSCINKILLLPHCEEMIQSLRSALGLVTNSEKKSENKELKEGKDSAATILPNGNFLTPEASKLVEITTNIEENGNHQSASMDHLSGHCLPFQVVPNCTSHKWLNVENGICNAVFLKAIQKEHKLFHELPEGIYVRGYEDRLDLLHAVIVGPQGTPFDSTPFFFEIKLPDEYPNKPPRVNFVPYSTEAINPNLYQEGKVCLSLLGTWAGKKSEKWDPSLSNLHQVLLSIQGLILNAEPYWNEPGREHARNDPQQIIAAQRYNEATTINSIQYMERIFESPPPAFDRLIRGIILEKLQSYRTRIESWFVEDGPLISTPEYPLPKLSKGFQLAVTNALDRVQKSVDSFCNSQKTSFGTKMTLNDG